MLKQGQGVASGRNVALNGGWEDTLVSLSYEIIVEVLRNLVWFDGRF